MNEIQIIERFAILVRQFCSVIDEAAKLDRAEILGRIYPLLPKLIDRAIALPKIEETEEAEDTQSDDDLPKKSHSTHEDRRQIYLLLQEKLGDWDQYCEIFDPNKDMDPIGGSLADDLADIYFDLKEGLELHDSGESEPGQVIWEWRFSFDIHWGEHALGALTPGRARRPCRVSTLNHLHEARQESLPSLNRSIHARAASHTRPCIRVSRRSLRPASQARRSVCATPSLRRCPRA